MKSNPDLNRDGAYLDLLPGSTLAEVNLVSFLGLHRKTRGAMIGEIAVREIPAPAEDHASATAMRRLGLGDQASAYSDESNAGSEKLRSAAVFDMAEGQARIDPSLAPDIILEAKSLLAVQKHLVRRVMDRWQEGASSLLAERPLPYQD